MDDFLSDLGKIYGPEKVQKPVDLINPLNLAWSNSEAIHQAYLLYTLLGDYNILDSSVGGMVQWRNVKSPWSVGIYPRIVVADRDSQLSLIPDLYTPYTVVSIKLKKSPETLKGLHKLSKFSTSVWYEGSSGLLSAESHCMSGALILLFVAKMVISAEIDIHYAHQLHQTLYDRGNLGSVGPAGPKEDPLALIRVLEKHLDIGVFSDTNSEMGMGTTKLAPQEPHVKSQPISMPDPVHLEDSSIGPIILAPPQPIPFNLPKQEDLGPPNFSFKPDKPPEKKELLPAPPGGLLGPPGPPAQLKPSNFSIFTGFPAPPNSTAPNPPGPPGPSGPPGYNPSTGIDTQFVNPKSPPGQSVSNLKSYSDVYNYRLPTLPTLGTLGLTVNK